MTTPHSPMSDQPTEAMNAHGSGGWWGRWIGIPLYLRIVVGLALGAIVGVILGHRAAPLAVPSQILLRLLGAIAPPLILIAVIRAVMNASVGGRVAGRIAFLLILNTVVAILIGLLVANVIRPGSHGKVDFPTPNPAAGEQMGEKKGPDPVEQFLDQIPDSLVKPLVENNVIGVIFVALAFGVALREVKNHPVTTAAELVDLSFHATVTVLEWVINLVPIGVFCIVANVVGTKGFAPFAALAWFVLAVLIGLALQACYYLIRIRFGSWVRPGHLLNGMKDALIMAFSTDSSTATMPVTYACLKDKVGLREESASLGALVGSNFNNDGTALYEAMSALFVSQLIGMQLGLWPQVIVILTSVVASVGAAGIPEAGIVTMTLVFKAVQLPPSYIPLLLTVDWFLDRSRTVINVMGDMNVSCLLDGKVRKTDS